MYHDIYCAVSIFFSLTDRVYASSVPTVKLSLMDSMVLMIKLSKGWKGRFYAHSQTRMEDLGVVWNLDLCRRFRETCKHFNGQSEIAHEIICRNESKRRIAFRLH